MDDDKISRYGERWYTFTASAEKDYSFDWGDFFFVNIGHLWVSAYKDKAGTIPIFEDKDSSSLLEISGYGGPVYLKVENRNNASNIWIKYIEREGPGPALDTPTGLAATSSNGNAVSLSWNSVEGASSYGIYQSTAQDGKYTLQDSSESTSWRGIVPIGKISTYHYKVTALPNPQERGQESEMSGSVSVTLSMVAPPASAIPLTEGEWIEGEIAERELVWYSFDADAKNYDLHWEDKKSTGSDKTGTIKVSAYESDGKLIFEGPSSFYYTPSRPYYNSSYSGTVYLKIEGHAVTDSGTYAIKYQAQE
jgi:hypothetical protein